MQFVRIIQTEQPAFEVVASGKLGHNRGDVPADALNAADGIQFGE
jgi:hypothetical protein